MPQAICCCLGLPRWLPGSSDRESTCDVVDLGSTPGLGRSPGEGFGNSLQYSCLENPMDRGVWWSIVAKSRTQLSNGERLSTCFLFFHLKVISNSFGTPWTGACQAPLSLGFSRQAYWSGLPFPSPWDLPNPGIKLVSPAFATRFFTTKPLGKSH